MYHLIMKYIVDPINYIRNIHPIVYLNDLLATLEMYGHPYHANHPHGEDDDNDNDDEFYCQ